jgi:hypothetical protein
VLRELRAAEARRVLDLGCRFTRREPLFRVHECVFGVLALESEPVDPRRARPGDRAGRMPGPATPGPRGRALG